MQKAICKGVSSLPWDISFVILENSRRNDQSLSAPSPSVRPTTLVLWGLNFTYKCFVYRVKRIVSYKGIISVYPGIAITAALHCTWRLMVTFLLQVIFFINQLNNFSGSKANKKEKKVVSKKKPKTSRHDLHSTCHERVSFP